MSYQDIEERKKRKNQFATLYIITVVVILSICTAFLIPPQVVQTPTVAKQTTTYDTTADVSKINEQWLQLQLLWTHHINDENKHKEGEEFANTSVEINDVKKKFQNAIDSLEENISTSDTTLAQLISVYRNLVSTSFVYEPQTKSNDLTDDSRLTALQLQVQQKDEQIRRLKQNIVRDVRPATNIPDTEAKAAKDAKFLSWALSSQSNEMARLRKENADLKAKMNDLKKNK